MRVRGVDNVARNLAGVESLCAAGRNPASSRRNTPGYVASGLSTHKPVVDEDPTATIRSAPAFRRTAVRAKGAPSEMLWFADKQNSAADCDQAPSGWARTTAMAAHSVPTRRHVSHTAGQRITIYRVSNARSSAPFLERGLHHGWRAIPANAGPSRKRHALRPTSICDHASAPLPKFVIHEPTSRTNFGSKGALD